MCMGASQGLKDTGKAQESAYATATKQAAAEFGDASTVFNDLKSSFEPTVAAGPNQQGWSAAEASAINANSINTTGAQYRNAATTVKELNAASGGGSVALPSGANIGTELALAEAGANQTSSELNSNLIQNYAQGNQNYQFATKGLEAAPGVFSTGNQATDAATGAGSASSKTQNDITQANNSWMQLASAAIGGVSGVMTGGITSALKATNPNPSSGASAAANAQGN